jgi:25S rRNA (uracil2634-N3)-methyltransferase
MEHCVPCLYKVFPWGQMALPPNQRPEMCIRSGIPADKRARGLYSGKSDKVLILGDGDFSFSLSIATAVHKRSIFTSHESHSTLLDVYPGVQTILDETRRAAKAPDCIMHEVDATDLARTSALDCHRGSFDVVAWNFPCIRMPAGKDGQAEELQINQDLCRSFFQNVRPYLKPTTTSTSSASTSGHGAEVHITHKVTEPFSWWGMEALAQEAGLVCAGRLVFDKFLYTGYNNRKVLSNRSFPCHDATTFVFKFPEETEKDTTQDKAEKKDKKDKKDKKGEKYKKKDKSGTRDDCDESRAEMMTTTTTTLTSRLHANPDTFLALDPAQDAGAYAVVETAVRGAAAAVQQRKKIKAMSY